MTINPNLFYSLTNLPYVGLSIKSNIPDEWSDDYHGLEAKQMTYNPNANLSSRILAQYMKMDTQILYYIICHILVPRSSNPTQATKEDLILIWAILTSREINSTHFI